ncbi:MAG: NAD-dependent epimerase/dehydratase family protein [Bryobacteraceae bacterium]
MRGKPALLITGCEGLIGQRISEALHHDYRIIGLDVLPDTSHPERIEYLRCDLTSDSSVEQTMQTVRDRFGKKLASVIHLAAYYSFSGEPSPMYRDLTVEGTRRLLRALREFEAEQFVFSSTLLVMAPSREGEPIREDSPVAPAWAYPQSKVEAEAVIHQGRGSIPAVILRIAGVYDEDCHSVPIAQHIARIYERQFESYFFPGNPNTGQAFVHLDDLVACFRLVIEHRRDLEPYEVFLIAEPDVMSYHQLQDTIGELLHGREWPTFRIPKAVAKAGAWAEERLLGGEEKFIKPWMVDLADQHYPVASDKARAKLGWNPRHRLRRTLPEIIRRLNQDPAGWYQRNKLRLPVRRAA